MYEIEVKLPLQAWSLLFPPAQIFSSWTGTLFDAEVNESLQTWMSKSFTVLFNNMSDFLPVSKDKGKKNF